MPKVTFITKDGKKTIFTKNNTKILDAAKNNGIHIEHACNGNGVCTTCACKILTHPDNLTKLTEKELSIGVSGDIRLSCQAKIKGDIELEIR